MISSTQNAATIKASADHDGCEQLQDGMVFLGLRIFGLNVRLPPDWTDAAISAALSFWSATPSAVGGGPMRGLRALQWSQPVLWQTGQ